MSEISKAYEPQSVEDKWYDLWVKQGCFTANPARVSARRAAYSIVIPPPNITGVLHMGHVLNNTIQDILARKARMDRKEVLWLPGTDHASIATHMVMERELKKKEGLTRHDLGREKFLERAWKWKEQYGSSIIQQLKKLGCSCDWSRERFTMDPDYSRCVERVFVELYTKGLIYRGKRMVNWCPATLTALSDEEVVMKTQNGFLYYFKVEVVGSALPHPSASAQTSADKPAFGPVTGAQGRTWLTIATTRPETIPGDTAVAVNPKDKRYAHLIGKHVVRPLPPELPREQKLIPIIGDEQIDIEFGTGVLKVTPAHDQADFAIGQRHNLPVPDIMNPNATMNAVAGADLVGLDRFKARKVAAEKLKELGLLEKEEPYQNNIGYSERADVPIEPRLSEQWFLKYPSVDKAHACVEQEESARDPRADSGGPPESSSELLPSEERALGGPPNAAREPRTLPDKMRFYPPRWAKVYDHWMANIQDWCISRQLWWGHRIPVWYRPNPSPSRPAEYPSNLDNAYYVETYCGIEPPAGEGWEQDPDVLDTWFSSWLWPFATMGWTGDKSQDAKNPTLQAFYPTTDLVTAPEIIFFWVARMIMAGYEFMGEMPFRNVYFTGIVRDKQGRKMSKSLGNSPDPLELIARYGADAVRFGTMRSAPLGQDVLFDEKDVELGRNFCNKLWNACRFRQMQESAGGPPAESGGSPDSCEIEGEINPALLTSDDKWILLRLDKAIREITAALAEYRFNEAAQVLYRFFWSEYCDWYVEASKATLGRSASEMSPSPLNGERAGVRGENGASATTSPHPIALPLAERGGELEARRANTLAVIDFILSNTLRLFHPFLPFITEELWHGLGFNHELPEGQGDQTIMNAHWPKPLGDAFKEHYGLDESDERLVEARYELVTRGRNLRRESNVPANKKVRFVLKPGVAFSAHDIEVLKILLNAEALEVSHDFLPAKGTPTARSQLGELYLPLEGLVDVESAKARLKKEIANIESEIDKAQSKLNHPAFTQRAPPAVLEEHRKRLADWQNKLEQARTALAALES